MVTSSGHLKNCLSLHLNVPGPWDKSNSKAERDSVSSIMWENSKIQRRHRKGIYENGDIFLNVLLTYSYVCVPAHLHVHHVPAGTFGDQNKASET